MKYSVYIQSYMTVFSTGSTLSSMLVVRFVPSLQNYIHNFTNNPLALGIMVFHCNLQLKMLVFSHVLCVDTGRSSETAKAHRG
eukprot:TRINITY_DN13569_c0_g1_i1.p1 TRINITY_DN13569_c0_g1~~TRINITY_DN13569_c0_g1_i1.p1  ORF type:complete len:83 (+),score=3.59 TRINITY_DN13569_c0_g1_i1:218-466(+)